jgi:hypothetical protein
MAAGIETQESSKCHGQICVVLLATRATGSMPTLPVDANPADMYLN